MKTKNKKISQSFAAGALIIAVGMLIVKIAGAAFKIPLASILRAEGLGYFNLAYNLYNPLYALATAGLPIAISRMVAKNVAEKRYKDVRMIHKISIPMFVTTGLVGSILMIIGAQICVMFTSSPDVIYSIWALTPTVFFSCMISIYKGYYEGLRNMIPTAVSEIVEAIGKVIFGLGFAYAAVECGMNEYYNYGTVFGRVCESESMAQNAVLPFASAGAVLGITLGAISGFIYIYIKYKLTGDGITQEELENSSESRPKKVLMKMLIDMAVPVALGAIIMNVAGFIDAMLILNRIKHIMDTVPDAILNVYGSLIPQETIKEKNVHVFMSGCFGYMNTITMMLPTITQSFAISALPNVTSAWVKGIKEKIKKSIETVLKITSLIAFPIGIGMATLAYPIMDLVYGTIGKGKNIGEIHIAADIMVVYALATVFVAISMPICSMLQAIGRADLPLKILTIGMVLKVVFNYLLVGIPQVNIQGAGIGTLICYVFICISGVALLCRETHFKFDLWKIFGKPLVCSLICGVSAYLFYGVFVHFLNIKIATIVSISLAGVVYILMLFLTKTVTSEELKNFPKGKKIIKILEKCHLIG
ncbi:MAG: polysaccharide biosynthesis protein [Clostridia bacterium]|nr:polysaccharide biosynthesis protein [Clostridia bacterium]